MLYLASEPTLFREFYQELSGGIVVGVLSGSDLAVSGPAAGLTTVVAASIISLGDFQTFY